MRRAASAAGSLNSKPAAFALRSLASKLNWPVELRFLDTAPIEGVRRLLTSDVGACSQPIPPHSFACKQAPTRPPPSYPKAAWHGRRDAHEQRVRAWTDPHQARTARGEKHPVHDFLFEYYRSARRG